MKTCEIFECMDNTTGQRDACCCECDRAEGCANICYALAIDDECELDGDDD